MRPGPPSPSRRRPPRRHPPDFRHPARAPQWQRQRQRQRRLPSTQAIILLILLTTGQCLALVDSPTPPRGLSRVFADPLHHQQPNNRQSYLAQSTSSSSEFTSSSSQSVVAASSLRDKNRGPKTLTIGYLSAVKGALKDRQGLAISGALTMALDEVKPHYQLR